MDPKGADYYAGKLAQSENRLRKSLKVIVVSLMAIAILVLLTISEGSGGIGTGLLAIYLFFGLVAYGIYTLVNDFRVIYFTKKLNQSVRPMYYLFAILIVFLYLMPVGIRAAGNNFNNNTTAARAKDYFGPGPILFPISSGNLKVKSRQITIHGELQSKIEGEHAWIRYSFDAVTTNAETIDQVDLCTGFHHCAEIPQLSTAGFKVYGEPDNTESNLYFILGQGLYYQLWDYNNSSLSADQRQAALKSVILTLKPFKADQVLYFGSSLDKFFVFGKQE